MAHDIQLREWSSGNFTSFCPAISVRQYGRLWHPARYALCGRRSRVSDVVSGRQCGATEHGELSRGPDMDWSVLLRCCG